MNARIRNTGRATSAEWIEEAPTIGGRVATLADYGLVRSTLRQSMAEPGTGRAGRRGHDPQETQVSTPSLSDSYTDGFHMQYGSSAQAAPAS